MRIRIAAAATIAAAGTLAALGTPALSQAADDGRDPAPSQGRPQVAETARSTGTSCTGGAQKKAFTGGQGNWFSTTGSTVVPGTTYQFQGPASGKDTVFVDLSAYDTYADSGQYGLARVTLDGTTMEPALTNSEYFNDSDNYSALVGQYCAKVGPGSHKVRVWLDSYYGGYVYLYNTMVHVEVAN